MLWWLTSLAVIALTAAQSKTQIPCGLPPFVDKLPEKQAKELREVWANYHNGSACMDEQKRTFEIVATLTEAEREAVFEFKAEPIAVNDHFDATPRFIRLISPEVRAGFDAIWTNITMPNDEKYQKLRDYAAQHFSAEQKTDFDNWLAEIIKARKAIDDRVSKLSPEAKRILDRLAKLRKEEHELMQSITPELGNELSGLI